MKRTILVALTAAAVLAASGCQSSVPSEPKSVELEVTDAGFVPANVEIRSGQPVVLLVTRRTDQTCAKEIVISGANIRRELPLNREVRIAFTPEKKGNLRYACGMDMIAGTLRVQ